MAIRGMTDFPIPGGWVVDFLDCRSTPGGEMGAMDIIEGTRRPAILRTSEGNFIPWMDGHTAGWASTLDGRRGPTVGSPQRPRVRLTGFRYARPR